MDIFHDDLRRLIPYDDNRKLTIRWTPGHVDIMGNEEADEHAKRVARGETSDTRELPKSLTTKKDGTCTLPYSKLALMQHSYAKIKLEATSIMSKPPHYALLNSIDPTVLSKKFARKIEKLPRRCCSLLIQLRTGHIALNKYLKQIGKSPTTRCPKCETHEESVHHFLSVCPGYAGIREALRAEVGPRQCSIKYLLSGKKGMRATLTYVAGMRRMENTFGDITTPPRRGRREKREKENTEHIPTKPNT
jgi:hypothetical protein